MHKQVEQNPAVHRSATTELLAGDVSASDVVESVLLERAQALAPQFAARALEFEGLRRLPADVAGLMGDAGFFRMFVEQRHGGLECSPSAAARVFESLAQGDPACGWVAFIGATTATLLARMSDTAVRAILQTPSTLITGVVAPNGRAEVVEDGFIVNGRWAWGSGSENAAWIAGGCLLTKNGELLTGSTGTPRAHMLFFPAADVRSLDNWHVSGLRGTGSTDYEVHDLFVPTEFASGYSVRAMPALPLFQFPQNPLLASGIGAVALGAARAAIDDCIGIATEKKRAGSTNTIGARQVTHLEIATAEARLRAARLYYYGSFDDAWATAVSGAEVTLAQRREMRVATTFAVQSAVQVVDAMYTLAGGSVVYQGNRLQRLFRDVHVATQHIMVGTHTLETAGRLYLGMETNTVNF